MKKLLGLSKYGSFIMHETIFHAVSLDQEIAWLTASVYVAFRECKKYQRLILFFSI